MAATRKCLSTEEEFQAAVAESLSVRQLLGRTGLVSAGGNCKTVQTRIKQLGLAVMWERAVKRLAERLR